MCSGVNLMRASEIDETDDGLCVRCGDPVWEWEYVDKCAACLYDDEIDHQIERIIERMHGIEN